MGIIRLESTALLVILLRLEIIDAAFGQSPQLVGGFRGLLVPVSACSVLFSKAYGTSPRPHRCPPFSRHSGLLQLSGGNSRLKSSIAL